MKPTYAADTSVSVEKTRAEIETLLNRHGASRFGYMTADSHAVIGFMMEGKAVKFTLPLPRRDEKQFTHRKTTAYNTYAPRNPDDVYKAWEQACRSRWRSLYLNVKAKLEAVSVGITTFETEFLAHFVVLGGVTLGERIIPQLEEISRGDRAPSLMLE